MRNGEPRCTRRCRLSRSSSRNAARVAPSFARADTARSGTAAALAAMASQVSMDVAGGPPPRSTTGAAGSGGAYASQWVDADGALPSARDVWAASPYNRSASGTGGSATSARSRPPRPPWDPSGEGGRQGGSGCGGPSAGDGVKPARSSDRSTVADASMQTLPLDARCLQMSLLEAAGLRPREDVATGGSVSGGAL